MDGANCKEMFNKRSDDTKLPEHITAVKPSVKTMEKL